MSDYFHDPLFWAAVGVILSLVAILYNMRRNAMKDQTEKWDGKVGVSHCLRQHEDVKAALSRMGKVIDKHDDLHDRHAAALTKIEKYLIYLVQQTGGNPDNLLQ